MSHLILSIQKLLVLLDTVRQELDTQEELPKVLDSGIVSASISIKDTSDMLRKLVQGLLVLQQEQDLVSAMRLGVV